MARNPKGKAVFSSRESANIRRLLEEKCQSDHSGQMRLRVILRQRYGFYISDFTQSKSGFTVADFDALIRHDRISICA